MATTIHDARKAAHRLSRLNRSMLLLTKLENRQFATSEKVNFSAKLEQQLSEMGELFEAAGYTVKIDMQKDIIMVTGSEYLTEILINNFLTNALKHATPGSSIQINLHPN